MDKVKLFRDLSSLGSYSMMMFAASKLSAESGVAEMFLILSTFYAHAIPQDS